MLTMRLQRIGRRNQPSYRMVITDSRNAPKSGKFIEVVGSYQPKEGTVSFKKERVDYWLEQGVQPSATVHNFLVSQKIIDAKKINVLPKKTAPVKEVVAEAQPEVKAEEPKTEETPAEAPVEKIPASE